MSAPPGSQRPSQRRPPVTDASAGPAESGTIRSSSASTRSQSSRTLTNNDKQISVIEKSVTHLLVATKQLLETLTQWSRQLAQEEEVSDVYVRLGYEFNLACRAFNAIGVETQDLGNVPDELRTILEDTLSQPASTQALDNYLPRIRDIIINLLHGLKRKQSKLRSRPSKDGSTSRSTGTARQGSIASFASNETGLTQMLEDVPSQTPSVRTQGRQDSVRLGEEQGSTLVTTSTAFPSDASTTLKRQSVRREISQPVVQSDSNSTLSSAAAQSIPALPPYLDAQQPETTSDSLFPYPPRPPPKQHDALAALQSGADLERRASRRFSTYQIQKQLGGSPNGIPVIPPAQNSPIPNRGREVRESMRAVRSRTSYQQPRAKSNNRIANISPSGDASTRAPQRIIEEQEEPPKTLSIVPEIPQNNTSLHSRSDDSITVKTPDEYHREPRAELADSITPTLGATLQKPLSAQLVDEPQYPETENKPVPPDHQQPIGIDERNGPGVVERKARANTTPPQSQIIGLEDSSPAQGKELTLFLQYKSKIKKFVLSDGYDGLTVARLQLAFIEKFAWNTHNNGVDLPEIYIQDPVSGVRHELEDLSDVKDRSVLVLNVEVLDEVKRHIDDGIGGIRKTLENVRSTIDGHGLMIQRFSDRQAETSKDLARMSAAPSRSISRVHSNADPLSRAINPSAASLSELQSLRRDIAVLRQTCSSMSSDFLVSMGDIRTKAASVKSIAADASQPSYVGDAGRAHVNAGKKTLLHDSEALVNHVDDLSDVVEDLRKDVVTRGVRPLPRQLEEVSRDISSTVKELAKMKEFLKREKPVWTKIWEQELDLVCTERDELTQQEDLMADLHGDLEDVTGVFKLVEQAMKQQNVQSNGVPVGGVSLRSTSRTLTFDGTDVDPHKAKDGVLGEVRALQPNHENRLEAIERAEKARQKELESRKGGDFQREVEKFVDEGRLRKTGGADEVERLRKIKDERARKENFETLMRRREEMEARERLEAAPAIDPSADNAGKHKFDGGEQEVEGHNTSQEGETAFEDANEQRAPSKTSTPKPPEVDPTSSKVLDDSPTLRQRGDADARNSVGDSEDQDSAATVTTPVSPSKRTNPWLPAFLTSP